MDNLLEDFITYFQTVDKSIEAGKNIWYETMLDKPDLAIGVYELPGHPILQQISGGTRKVRIKVRDKKVTVAKPLCDKLFKSLITDTGILQLTDDRWCTISLQGVPTKMEADENNRVYYSFVAVCTTYID